MVSIIIKCLPIQQSCHFPGTLTLSHFFTVPNHLTISLFILSIQENFIAQGYGERLEGIFLIWSLSFPLVLNTTPRIQTMQQLFILEIVKIASILQPFPSVIIYHFLTLRRRYPTHILNYGSILTYLRYLTHILNDE